MTQLGVDLTPHANGAVEHSDDASLVRFAIDKGVDVAVLERLMALQERVSDRNARAAFDEAVAAFQASCPPLHKSVGVDYTTKSGVRIKYNFAPLDTIARTTRPHLAAQGLSYSWDSVVESGEAVVTCTLHHVAGHSRTATFRGAIEGAGSPQMNAMQKAGAALTYGQRYSLIQVLGLTTADDDVDGGQSGGESISEEQLADLESLLEEVKADRARFLEYMGVEAMAGIPATDFRRACKALEQYRKKAAS